MKSFLEIFLICLVLCSIGAIFFLGLLVSNIWAMVVLLALFLSIIINVFVKLSSRIEDLEEKVKQLPESKHDL